MPAADPDIPAIGYTLRSIERRAASIKRPTFVGTYTIRPSTMDDASDYPTSHLRLTAQATPFIVVRHCTANESILTPIKAIGAMYFIGP